MKQPYATSQDSTVIVSITVLAKLL